MLDQKLLEVLQHPADGAIAIVTQGAGEPHVANTWNSYANITADDKLLFPAAGMNQTQQNIEKNNKVQLTVANRQVQGKMYPGTGFLVKGTARFITEGAEVDMMKTKFPWLRAVLEITVESAVQTL
ncbi:pyridoxamine 5'-phosphate oxidase family protein [Desulfitobacterium sp. THU1]|uniref:pyridoxamine 5'-phosphate oxidase family protein n=1 Tax=Desulfitobacterium sp. THU1 TaxID=3138072 RepID=UPI0031202CC9